MNTITGLQYTGKKARVGGITFLRNHLVIFAGYCPECHGKIVMERTEAEQFANKYCYEQKRKKNRWLIRAIDNRAI